MIFRADEIKLAYKLEIQSRFEILENNPELVLKSSSPILKNIIEAHKHAANLHVPLKKKTKHEAP